MKLHIPLLALSLAVFLNSCGPQTQVAESVTQNVSQPVEQQDTIPITDPGIANPDHPIHQFPLQSEVCYPGQKTRLCVGTVTANSSSLVKRDYNYRDPKTDPTFPSNFDKKIYTPPKRFLDLAQINLSQFVAPSFQFNEFLQVAKGPYGILSSKMIQALQKIRTALAKPLVVNSAYRSPGYNARVDGSATWSRHQYGDAVDISSRGTSLKTIQNLCNQAKATFILSYTAHVHCDWRGQDMDPAFFDLPLDPPTLKTLDNDILSLRSEITQQMSEMIDTRISGVLKTRQRLLFESKLLVHEDDEGDVPVKVEMQFSNGAILTRYKEQFEFSAPAGFVFIRTTYGDSLVREESIWINP